MYTPRPSMFLTLVLLCMSLFAQASALDDRLLSPQGPLPAEKAFVLSVDSSHENEVVLHWTIAPGTYLYQKAFIFSTTQAQLGDPKMPTGEEVNDAYFGKTIIYRQAVTIDLPVIARQQRNIDLKVEYQGCNDMGFCYPPQDQVLHIELEHIDHSATHQDAAMHLLEDTHFAIALLSFFGFGLLLAFTPCVLPMIPILSALILDEQQHHHRRHAFFLALTYVLAMASTYAGLGAMVATLGSLIQAQLQTPWVISITAGILAFMAYWLAFDHRFTVFTRFNHPLHKLSQRLPRGEYVAVALMGAIASLVVSPCVTAPLVGALSYIAMHGNVLLGAGALFCLGLGMGVPLIAFTWGGTALLPKSGAWMHTVKLVFSFILLGMAISLLGRFLYPPMIMVLWGLLSYLLAYYLKPMKVLKHKGARLRQGFAWIFLIYGTFLVVGGLLKHNDIAHPLDYHPKLFQQVTQPALPFTLIENESALKKALQESAAKHEVVMLDFYADWCKSCVTIEHTHFQDEALRSLLLKVKLLKVDVTHYNADLGQLMKQWHVFGPPTFLFFNEKGQEVPDLRLVGEASTACFIAHITALNSKESAANCSE